MPVTYSLGKTMKDNKPVQQTAPDFDSFAQAVLATVSPRKYLTYICAPLAYGTSPKLANTGEANWRCKEGALPRNWLPFDIDGFRDMAALEEVREWFSQWAHFGYTTASHLSPGKDGLPRARIIVSLNREVTRDEGIALGQTIQRMCDAALPGRVVRWDATIYDAEHECFTPVAKDGLGNPFQHWHFEEVIFEPVDVDALLRSRDVTEAESTPEHEPLSDDDAEAYALRDPVYRELVEQEMVYRMSEPGMYAIACPCADEHTSETSDSATVYYPGHGGGMPGYFHCLHDHCTGRKQDEFVEALGLDLEAVRAERLEQRHRFDAIPEDERDPAGEEDSGFHYASLHDLQFNPPPEREWCISEWLPLGTVASLFAPGGSGKSLLAQQIATHVAAGQPIFGLEVSRGPVLAFLCEDDNDELRRRQQRIQAGMMLDAAPSELYLDGRAGKRNTLVTFGSNGRHERTSLLKRIDAECARVKPKLLVIDNIAQVYAGLENDRHQVTVFCNELTGIARRHNCAVLLLGHTAKAEGSQYSGSTAWEAAVRTRLYLERREDGTMTLHKAKANYSALDSISLEYRHGYLFPLTSAGAEPVQVHAAKAAVREALEHYTAQQITTSNSPTARNYLVTLMRKDGLLAGYTVPVVAQALTAMVATGELTPNSELGWITPSRHKAQGLKPRVSSAALET